MNSIGKNNKTMFRNNRFLACIINIIRNDYPMLGILDNKTNSFLHFQVLSKQHFNIFKSFYRSIIERY